MKMCTKIILTSLLILLTASCKDEPKKEKTICQRIPQCLVYEYPKELQALKLSLSKELQNVSIDIFPGNVDSTWELNFSRLGKEKGDVLFSYDILPLNLSSEKRDEHQHFGMLKSCIIDEYTCENFEYQNYFLQPACGNVDESEKKIVDAFYQALDKLGSKETKRIFYDIHLRK